MQLIYFPSKNSDRVPYEQVDILSGVIARTKSDNVFMGFVVTCGMRVKLLNTMGQETVSANDLKILMETNLNLNFYQL